MDIFVYSDESGVFDKKHQDWFVFGGLIFLSKEEKDIQARKYIHAEKCLRKSGDIPSKKELKATLLRNSQKNKLFRSLNNCYKFGVSVQQAKVLDSIYAHKKSKQRYLDYAYKIALKRALQSLIQKGLILPKDVKNIYVYVDEHTTATNGRYELQEGLEQEFKLGTYNFNYNTYYKPLFSGINGVSVSFCDSRSQTLIRAADIVANKIYYDTLEFEKTGKRKERPNLHHIFLP